MGNFGRTLFENAFRRHFFTHFAEFGRPLGAQLIKSLKPGLWRHCASSALLHTKRHLLGGEGSRFNTFLGGRGVRRVVMDHPSLIDVGS